jgi:rRNA maturation endonuclease Nob1
MTTTQTLVFLSVVIAGVAWAGYALRRKRERKSWFYRSRCLGCGYMLRGSGERCPECGRPIWA